MAQTATNLGRTIVAGAGGKAAVPSPIELWTRFTLGQLFGLDYVVV